MIRKAGKRTAVEEAPTRFYHLTAVTGMSGATMVAQQEVQVALPGQVEGVPLSTTAGFVTPGEGQSADRTDEWQSLAFEIRYRSSSIGLLSSLPATANS